MADSKVAVKPSATSDVKVTEGAEVTTNPDADALTKGEQAEKRAAEAKEQADRKAADDLAAAEARARTMDPVANAGGTSVADLEAARAASAALHSDEGDPCSKCYPKGWPDQHEAGARVSCAHGTWVKE